MQVSVSTTGALGRRVEVAVPAAEIAQAVDERIRRMSGSARMKGFRPGKVPHAVLRQQYGDAVHEEVVRDVVRSSLGDALEAQKLQPASTPQIESLTAKPGAELRYSAVFEILPEVQVRDPAGIKLSRPTVQIQEAEVEAMLLNMRRQRAKYVEYAGAARDRDRLLVDHEIHVDNQPVPDTLAEDAEIVIGGGRNPSLEDALKGAVAGEQRKVDITLGPQFRDPALAGRAGQLHVTIKRVDEPILPEVDEEFCRAYGVEEGGPEVLRREVRASMEHEVEGRVRYVMRSQVLEALVRENPLEVPNAMVQAEMQRLQNEAGQRSQITDPARLPPLEDFRNAARQRVVLSLLLQQIVDSQNLTPDPARVQEIVDDQAQSFQDPENARQQLVASKEFMAQVQSMALEEKVIAWVLASAEVTDQPISFAELTGFAMPVQTAEDPASTQGTAAPSGETGA